MEVKDLILFGGLLGEQSLVEKCYPCLVLEELLFSNRESTGMFTSLLECPLPWSLRRILIRSCGGLMKGAGAS